VEVTKKRENSVMRNFMICTYTKQVATGIKSEKIGWVGHVAHMEMKSNPEENRPVIKSWHT
jgi:hypothetical protein